MGVISVNRPAEIADVIGGGPPAAATGSGMDVVHPLAGNLAASASIAQRQQSAGNAQQVRRAQALRKDVAADGDRFEHQVESTEELSPVHDGDEHSRNDGKGSRRKRKPNTPPTGPSDETPGIDLTA